MTISNRILAYIGTTERVLATIVTRIGTPRFIKQGEVNYLRPDGISLYYRPDGISLYKRPLINA